MDVKAIPIVQIRTDGGTQIRTSTYFDKIEEYTQAMLDGAAFPPLTVFWDGEDYWLADGFHRLDALAAVAQALNLRRYAVECEVIEGGRREAILYACGANDAHGIQRTPADKQAAVKTVLTNPLVSINPITGEPWGDREIARICNVGHQMVGKLRPSVTGRATSQNRTYRHNKSGKPTVMKTGGINKDRAEAKGRAAADKAEGQDKPEAEAKPAPFKQSTEWDHLYTLLRQVDEAIGGLPAPDVAAANFPISLAHGLPIGRVVEIQRWWQDFTRFWAARDPEIQRHRQEVRDFIRESRRESRNVAAE